MRAVRPGARVLAMERPVCVVGISGQIGEWVARRFREGGYTVVGTYYRHPRPGAVPLDASEAGQVRELMARLNPWLVVNSLNAKGGTDACEVQPGLAERAHVETARHLMDAARSIGAMFVQISTDYVFDGAAGPYREEDLPAPLSRLGRAKLAAEQYALAQSPGALVVRTSFVFSWTPESQTKNFVMQILDNDRAGTVISVPNDQVGNVTYAPNFAQALVELVARRANGVFHVAGTTRCSKYEWALRVAKRFGLRWELIRGVTTAELGQAGPRPLQSGFRLEKVQALLRTTQLMSLDEGLAEMASEMRAIEPVAHP